MSIYIAVHLILILSVCQVLISVVPRVTEHCVLNSAIYIHDIFHNITSCFFLV